MNNPAKVKLVVSYDPPPIPLRQYDWHVYDDRTYDGPGSIVGWGRTQQAAITNFWAQWEEKYGLY